jgi:hypothetical protein
MEKGHILEDIRKKVHAIKCQLYEKEYSSMKFIVKK